MRSTDDNNDRQTNGTPDDYNVQDMDIETAIQPTPIVIQPTSTDTMSIITTEPDQLISTNHTQPDNENNGIPVLSDAIDKQLKPFYIRSTPGSTYRVDDRSTSPRIVIKDVFIPVNNTEAEIIRFLKEHTIAAQEKRRNTRYLDQQRGRCRKLRDALPS
ncbi:hypothetical protein K1T71_014549 [Dendrolimus kikuchii]|uniref:Uncharacterized protein n=1 Tax=Dendrolimus kikuchii TaxID=765133 RepID=A0ACC1CEF6_9NEOP|nr:hypothetical protein K1T71_014549 [Dendrolimus kikuchii]